jgi:transposase
MGETITLNKKEQKRLLVLNRVMAGQMTAAGAAELLGLSERQVRRILAAYREEGAAALVHGNRGRAPTNALGPTVREQVTELARSKYVGFNHQHMAERLEEEERIPIKRSSLRRILLAAGIVTPRKRRPPKHRSRRERYPQEGMLLQIDASRHDWLQGRGPYLSLLGAIDDATGEVVHALFREQEDAQGYFLLLKHIVLTKGCPTAIYRDRHGIFEVLSKAPLSLEEQLAGKRGPTQFGRCLEELGITSIGARSPQAKGRIERLWGTFQDRLVAEMRLAGVSTMHQANQFLPDFLDRYNQRFRVPPAQPGSAYRALPAELDPETVFCFKYHRVVAADNTVSFEHHCLQLLPDPERASYARANVEVQERLDGSLAVYYQGRSVASKAAPMGAVVLRARKGSRKATPEPKQLQGSAEGGSAAQGPNREAQLPVLPSPASPTRPAAPHPWKRPFKLSQRLKVAQGSK